MYSAGFAPTDESSQPGSPAHCLFRACAAARFDPAFTNRMFVRLSQLAVHCPPALQIKRRQRLAVLASRSDKPSLFDLSDALIRGVQLGAQPDFSIKRQVRDLRINQDHRGALHQAGWLVEGRHPRCARQGRSSRPPCGHGDPAELGRGPVLRAEVLGLSAEGDDFIKHWLNVQINLALPST